MIDIYFANKQRSVTTPQSASLTAPLTQGSQRLVQTKGSLLFDVSQNRGELSTKLTEGY